MYERYFPSQNFHHFISDSDKPIYLFAVQIEILVTDLQLQNLHLVVPLLYNGGVPHRPSIQRRFSPTHYLQKEKEKVYLAWISAQIQTGPKPIGSS